MKNRILVTVLSLTMAFSLFACGKPQETMEVGSISSEQVEESIQDTTDEAVEEQTDSVEEGKTEENSSQTENETVEQTTSNSTSQEDSNTSNTEEQTDNQASEVGEGATTEDTSVNASTPKPAETGTPVANHGELSVKGTSLVDKNGNPYQIQGVSTHGIGWFPQYIDKEGFRTMRDEWGVNCIRLAMYSAEGSGYCTGGNQSQLKQLVMNGVDYATDLGMYVIIDWHVLGEQDPNVYKSTAIEFFKEMSALYANYDNVIYEICNEPNGGTSWSQVKSYAEEVIPVIKANNPNAIIIVGTPTWSQDVDQAAANPIKGYTNIMYTIHFYADTHRDSLRQKMLAALNSGLPIFCTEFGICDASGSGSNNKTEGNTWIATMDANNISYCIWNLSNKSETSALIASGCNKTSGWTMNDLSDSGKWYVGILNNGVEPGSTPSVYSGSDNNNNNNNNNGNNNNGNNNGGNSQSSPAVTATAANTEATISSGNSWNSGSTNNYQYTLTVRNTGSTAIKDWKVTVNFGTNVSIDQSWNGTLQAGGTNVTITPVDFNKEIAPGQSVEVGFILSTNGTITNPVVSIN